MQNLDLGLTDDSAVLLVAIRDRGQGKPLVANSQPGAHCGNRRVEQPRRPELPAGEPLPDMLEQGLNPDSCVTPNEEQPKNSQSGNAELCDSRGSGRCVRRKNRDT